jgi:hypothetical protein
MPLYAFEDKSKGASSLSFCGTKEFESAGDTF